MSASVLIVEIVLLLSGCPAGMYDVAKGCRKVCKCKFGSCDPIDGSCTCYPGYGGMFCDKGMK